MILNSRKKSCTIFSSKLGFKIRFKATGVSCTFRVPKKNHPCCTAGERTFAGKDFAPVLAVGRMILWFDLGMFFARWLLAKIHGGLLPQKHGQNLCLSCPLLWLLGPNIIKQTLYLVRGRPWAACSMDVVSFSITSKCTRTCDT